MDAWKEYLFAIHGEPTLLRWAHRLHLFRFCRAFGGMNNDGDDLLAVFQYRDSNDLLEFFKFVGIKVVQYQEEPPQKYTGRTVQGKALIDGIQWIEQLGHCQIAGQKVFVWCLNSQIKVSVSDGYEVTEGAVRRAEIVEKLLKDAPLPRIEPPLDDKHCLCPRYYPEYFR